MTNAISVKDRLKKQAMEDGKLYLYDIIKIKKETSTLFQSKDLTQ